MNTEADSNDLAECLYGDQLPSGMFGLSDAEAICFCGLFVRQNLIHNYMDVTRFV